MGKNFAHNGKAFLLGLAFYGLLLGQTPASAQIDPSTLELPQIGLEGSEACDNTPNGVNAALNSAGNYTVNQEFVVSQGLMRQPVSFFTCLQPLIKGANTLINAFGGDSNTFSISGLLQKIAKYAIAQIIAQIQQNLCQATSGITGHVQLYNLYPEPSVNPPTPVTSISGATVGTSTNDMSGNPNSTPDPLQAAKLPTSVVQAQNTGGSSVADQNQVVIIDSQRFGPHTPAGYTSVNTLKPIPSVNYDDWKPSTDPDSSATPDPPTAPPAPAPPKLVTPALPVGTDPSAPATTGTNLHGGFQATNYQNVQIGRTYGARLQCVQMFRAPSPPSLGNLGAFGEYPTRAPIHAGTLVMGLTDLSSGVIVATFLGPGGNFNTQQVYGYQHIGMYKSQNAQFMTILNQYRHSGGAKIDHLLWHSGSTPDWHGDKYYVALKG